MTKGEFVGNTVVIDVKGGWKQGCRVVSRSLPLDRVNELNTHSLSLERSMMIQIFSLSRT
jgi:hypothetical protein